MGLAQDIDALRARSLAGLRDAHDYYAFTRAMWRSMQTAATNRELLFVASNPTTGTVLDEIRVLAMAPKFLSEDLASAALQQFLVLFEGFLSEALELWLFAHPRALAAKQVAVEDILLAADKDTLVRGIVRREVAKVMYQSPLHWFKFLDDLAYIESPSAAERERLVELKATRDVIVHNQWIANAVYHEKARSLARAPEGAYLTLSEGYIEEAWRLLETMIASIAAGLVAKVP